MNIRQITEPNRWRNAAFAQSKVMVKTVMPDSALCRASTCVKKMDARLSLGESSGEVFGGEYGFVICWCWNANDIVVHSIDQMSEGGSS